MDIFCIKHHDKDQLPGLYEECTKFVESYEKILGDFLKSVMSNLYVDHFSRIMCSEEQNDTGSTVNALAALRCYDLIGIYENLPDFINNLGALIGIPAPSQLASVNVTRARPSVDQISAKLRDRIIELNELDLQLYAAVQDATNEMSPNLAPTVSAWSPLPARQPRIHETGDVIVHNVEVLNKSPVQAGGVVSFALEIELRRRIGSLETGIHIYDGSERWALGVNSTLLKQNHTDLKPGRYRLVYHVTARLPTGSFTAGFAFADTAKEPAQELFWHDALCAFSVISDGTEPGVGFAVCPARITLRRSFEGQQFDASETPNAQGVGS